MTTDEFILFLFNVMAIIFLLPFMIVGFVIYKILVHEGFLLEEE